MDNGYGYGVSIELERFTAAALKLDEGVCSSLPKTGIGDAEYWMSYQVGSSEPARDAGRITSLTIH